MTFHWPVRTFLYADPHYVPHRLHMPLHDPVISCKSRSSYGAHVLDHLAADGAGFAGGQGAVVAVLQVDADLPWCTPNILKCLSRVSLRYDKGEQMPGTSQRETGAAPVYREDTIGVMSRSTGLLRQETLELEGPPAHQ